VLSVGSRGAGRVAAECQCTLLPAAITRRVRLYNLPHHGFAARGGLLASLRLGKQSARHFVQAALSGSHLTHKFNSRPLPHTFLIARTPSPSPRPHDYYFPSNALFKTILHVLQVLPSPLTRLAKPRGDSAPHAPYVPYVRMVWVFRTTTCTTPHWLLLRYFWTANIAAAAANLWPLRTAAAPSATSTCRTCTSSTPTFTHHCCRCCQGSLGVCWLTLAGLLLYTTPASARPPPCLTALLRLRCPQRQPPSRSLLLCPNNNICSPTLLRSHGAAFGLSPTSWP